MAKIKVIEYHAQGYIYDNGDVPTCSFCGASAKDTLIHAGDYSGEHICESEECMHSYMGQNVWCKPFEKVEVEVDEDDVINW